jgi:exosortase
VSWLVAQWLDPGNNAGHSWLVPFVSIYIIWTRRKEWAESPRLPDNRGLLWIVFFFFLYWFGYRAQQPRFGVLTMIGLFWAVPLYYYGWARARLVFFPCVYLLFAIPMSFLSAFTFPLRLISASLAVLTVNGLGISAERVGTSILSPVGAFCPLDVDDPCSGLNSIIALTALMAAYGYLTQRTTLGKWILFLSALPIAMIGNVARVVVIVAAASTMGMDTAMRIYHEYSGYVVFVTVVLLMIWIGGFVSRWIPSKA